jgi:AcrR family transcriptional regulator
MVDPVNGARRYRSELRAQQTAATRRRVVEAARRLFVERGYAATTISSVASAAGVSDMTVYTAFADKRGLLEAVIGAAIGGPDLVPEPGGFSAIAELPTPRERLRAWVGLSCQILARTSAVHAVIRGAGDAEPFAVELRAKLLEARLAANRELLRRYAAGALRRGLTYDDAAERFCALTSPELYHLLTVELGWSLPRHARWLVGTLERELLSPPS